ncbi:ABC transporter permease [Actinoplanes sp. N902-109]|uniref:ABC transporter permease n=1 Tax=Actinoplanes sp. (strain N902-109) TaxID=649831 RepID=UPI0003295ED1|nr:ABC transporter permease [Actinoplanes sp. N902-109]AGL16254.1 binding-protein-dependent transport systems inner membrane component [Actinoplanes sp. N902-109]
MSRFLLRRLPQAIVVLFGVVTLAFLMTHVVPGDPARLIAGPNASAATVASIHRELGLDRSLGYQYWAYLRQAVQGDLGTSYALQGTSVASAIGHALPVSAAVAVLGVLWEVLLGVPIGIIAAYRPRGLLDRATTFASLIGLSAPPFWLGLLLLYALAYKSSVFPLSGYSHPYINYLILPSFTLGLGGAAWYARLTRTNMLEALRSPYVQTARAKGMPESVVLLRHCLRNVLSPLLTMLGMDLGYFLGGVVVIESVFGLPGVGKLTFDAIGTLDIPMITGAVLFAALFIVVMNLLVDLAYAAIDPRVRR